MEPQIKKNIDNIIDSINNKCKSNPAFTAELYERSMRNVPQDIYDKKFLKTMVELIAYSQNARSDLVDGLVKTGTLEKVFYNYDIGILA